MKDYKNRILHSNCFWIAATACLILSMGTDLSAGSADSGKTAKPEKVAFNKNAEPLRIAFISYANPQQVVRDSETVSKYLEQYVGVPIKGFVTLDYGSSIEAMRSEKADIAFVDPLAFMMAHEQIGAKPLLLEVYQSGTPA